MPKIVDHDQRRELIAATTARLIAEQGLEKATIREISKCCNFSRGVMEHYFSNKEDLIDTTLNWAIETHLARVEAAVGERKGLAAIRLRLENILPLSEASVLEWKVRLQIWARIAIDPGLQKQQAWRVDNGRHYFEKDLRQARQLGEIDASHSISQLSHQLIHFAIGISSAAMQNPAYYTRKRLLNAIDGTIQDLHTPSPL